MISNSPPTQLKPWRVWVIDDDPLARVVISDALRNELGESTVVIVELASFSCARQALACRAEVDLILLDNYLFDGEGIDLLPHIKAFSRACGIEQVPVMMVSANDDQAFLAQCFSQGASDYVTKPFDVYLLGNKAHAMLLAKRNRDQIIQQNAQLEQLIAAREREEAMARFTYDFYLRKTRTIAAGNWARLETPNAFSGDLLLSARSPEGRVFFMLVDATGHDLSAAITLLPLINGFQRMVEKGFRFSYFMHELNCRLLRDTPADRFVAALVMEIDPQSGLVHLWNGGMPPALVVNKNGQVVREFPSRHMSLGILHDDEFSAQTEAYPVESGDWFLLFSDGLPEQQNEQGTAFGYQQIKQSLGSSPEQSLQAVVEAHEKFRQGMPLNDDFSCCAVAPDLVIPASSRKPALTPKVDALKSLRGRDSFAWHYVVNGEHIATTQIPVLCSGFLEEMAKGQDLRERVFTIVTELFVNAVDHGLLRLESHIKQEPDGFFRYMQERERRLISLTDSDSVAVSIVWESQRMPQRLTISVCDTGAGFAKSSKLNSDELERCYGRGLTLAQSLSSRIEICSPGNCVRALLEGDPDDSSVVY